MARLNDDERAALRTSLGFSDLQSTDTFGELARQGRDQEPPSSQDQAIPRSAPEPDAVERMVRELGDLTAAVAGLTTQVAGSDIASEIRRELDEVARIQAIVVNRLSEVEREICRVTKENFDQLKERLDALESSGGEDRRHRRGVLRRANGSS